jgi:hypothetical protein
MKELALEFQYSFKYFAISFENRTLILILKYHTEIHARFNFRARLTMHTFHETSNAN